MDIMQNMTKIQTKSIAAANSEVVSVEISLNEVVASQEMQDILSMLKQEGLAKNSLEVETLHEVNKVH